ncbi:hypothetical protein MNBD_GAMMA25-769 [hydrothermal vent metagenome]|uniref:Uncharacterized protein n=1 Tax=hydrothermal vent metagenome TaxID=652676 RepID=A0A3B1B4V7_9ZZZZ
MSGSDTELLLTDLFMNDVSTESCHPTMKKLCKQGETIYSLNTWRNISGYDILPETVEYDH